jgi:TatD DNase family protein
MNIKYIDVHCHPFIEPLKSEQEAVITRMAEEGIVGLVVGVDAATSKEAVALAEKYDHLYATIGLHPNDTPTEPFDTTLYGSMVAHPKVVAVGECGIDYYRLSAESKVESGKSKEKQRQWENFEKQAEFAREHNKPLMIHCRPSKGTMDAYEEMITFLESKNLHGNMHFFVGNLDVAKRFWDIGFTTSYTGVLTFTHDYDEVVKAAPLEMLLTETDAPFAAPAPYRGQTNYPSYVPLVVEAIARIRDVEPEPIREAVLANAKRVFALK